jgi:predicted metal-dependent hydrolase
MAYKVFLLNDEKKVTIYKRRGSRSIKLAIDSGGALKVSIPTWVPYKAGLDFAKSKEEWINKHHSPKPLIANNQPVGKAHHILFAPEYNRDRPSASIKGSTIRISYPAKLDISDDAVQEAAQKASVRALRKQAESLLPQRLEMLANKHGFEYRNVTIKQLKSRWGSCDQNKDIVLNLYLMQVPWELIDYVLLHELTHTEVLRHGQDFWGLMEKILPNVKALKKKLREYKTVVHGLAEPTMA